MIKAADSERSFILVKCQRPQASNPKKVAIFSSLGWAVMVRSTSKWITYGEL